ncbi:MAG: hypothetical protein GTO17_07150 [Candidatus Aminicenantes bacterium]|nr:hypothetical protein [Candidatus Aminicenantes bacterium]
MTVQEEGNVKKRFNKSKFEGNYNDKIFGEVSKIKNKIIIIFGQYLSIRKIFLFRLFLILLLPNLQARLRFVGPNPYYSFLIFPQDSRLFNPYSSIFFLYYGRRGWRGHLDRPAIAPSPNYVATEESAQEDFYGTKIAEASFKEPGILLPS